MYEKSRYDLAGFAVGAVERKYLLPQLDRIKEGDVILGLASSGLHSNGYSLVRRIIEDNSINLGDIFPYDCSQSIGDILLTPTKIYVEQILPIIDQGLIKSMAHSISSLHLTILMKIVTGGGFFENIPRCLPKHIGAIIKIDSFPLPSIFKWIQDLGNIDQG